MNLVDRIKVQLEKTDASTREKNIARAYEQFMTQIDIPTTMTDTDFDRYVEIFDKSKRAAILDYSIPQDELLRLTKLSKEFYHRVNSQKPINIVSHVTGELLYTIPPLHMKLENLTGSNLRVLDAINQATILNDTAPGSLSAIKEKQYIQHLGKVLASSQSAEDIMQEIKKFDEMVDAIEGPPIDIVKVEETSNTVDTQQNAWDGLDFE